MDDKTRENSEKIIQALNDDEIKKEVEVVRASNPVYDLKLSIFRFFKNRLNHIEQDNRLISMVEDKIQEKIETDELTAPQLLNLLKYLKSEKIDATASMLDILKPVPNASSFMHETQPSDDEEKDSFKDMSRKDRELLQEFQRFALDIQQKKNEENKE